MKNLLLFSICTLFAFTACKKEEALKADEYLIFGNTYGFCIGNCVELYKLEDGKLYRDTLNSAFGPINEDSFEETPMSDSDLAIAQTVLDVLPENLWNDSNSRFGCPDCYDQGTIFVMHKKEGETKSWEIDPSVDDIPEYLRAFANKIMEAVGELE